MGRAPCCDKAKVKRGPWSPEEDAILKNYLHTHGTATNWIALPHKAGLKRCGKSCRLRWLNYLRPNIKHGCFTEEEDKIIFTLHSQMGSRWSLIASHLPGRTDNDVKNYWNTKLKKKLLLEGKTINNNNNNNININSPPNYNNINPNLAVSDSLPLPKTETNCSLTFWDSLSDVGTSQFSFPENMELAANNLINNYNHNILSSSSSSQEGSSCINIISDSSSIAGFEDCGYGLFPYYDDSMNANIGLLFEDKARDHHQVADSLNCSPNLEKK